MIHSHDPFATPESARSSARRLRGRFVGTVTLWTATTDAGPAGLTVSSCQLVDGDPGRVLGLIDNESDLWAAMTASGHFTVIPLHPGQQQLADRFAGQLPAPGGLFNQGEHWESTPYGPVIGDTWAGCRFDSTRDFGWSQLVEATLVEVVLGEPQLPLIHHRGAYRQLGER